MAKKRGKQSQIILLLFLLLTTIGCSLFLANENFSSGAINFFNESAKNSASDLVINEIMADNDSTIAGPYNTYPDWIEIYNSGENIIDLSGMYLTNDLNHVKGWKIPKNTTIQAGEYLVIWADKNLGDHGLHANFALFANEGTIALYENNGETLVDCVSYEKQLRDVSYGRIPNGDSQWQYLTIPTPGAANQPNPKSNTTSSVYTITAIIVIIIIIAIAFLIINKRAKRRTNF